MIANLHCSRTVTPGSRECHHLQQSVANRANAANRKTSSAQARSSTNSNRESNHNNVVVRAVNGNHSIGSFTSPQGMMRRIATVPVAMEGNTPVSSVTHASGMPSAANQPTVEAATEREETETRNTNAAGPAKGMAQNDVGLVNIKMFVKTQLFPKCKFIIKESDLEYKLDPNSIAQRCLTYLDMKGQGEAAFWQKWSGTVARELNVRRNHCQHYCKKAFLCVSIHG